jgi:2-polyprenyl-6-methoxyphenol hydroxylase-like FAD-dependent oxidoreductase
MADERVLVIGGGMAGLAVANGLKKAGIPFAVFERDAEDRRRQGYQLGLQDMGVAALRALGCDEVTKIIAREDTLTTVRVASARKEGLVELLHFGTGDTGIIDRRSLAALLRAPVREKVFFGKRLLRIEAGPGGSGVTAFFEDGTSESGSLLVGADGAKSAVRKQLFPDLEGAFHEDTRVGSFAFSLECARLEALGSAEVSRLLKLANRSLLRVLGPDAMSFLFMGYRDQEDGREKITFVFNHNVDAEGEVKSLPELRQKLAGKCAPLEAVFGCAAEEDVLLGGGTHVYTSLPATVSSLASYSPVLPVVLIGDAIHPMTSHRGLGANTAFVDAQELVERLKSNRTSLVREMWKSVCSFAGGKGSGQLTEQHAVAAHCLAVGPLAARLDRLDDRTHSRPEAALYLNPPRPCR